MKETGPVLAAPDEFNLGQTLKTQEHHMSGFSINKVS
jgi:hypothetical protein